MEGNMAKLENNRNQESSNQSFKQIEDGGWTGIYLPAICAGIIMTVVLLVAIACSKKSDNSGNRISAPAEPAASTPAAVTAATSTTVPAPKKIKKHRPANATYVNGTYGVSFSYPRKYSLAAGSGKAASAVQTSFLKPGAVQIAAVDVPDDSYPETDFSSAVLNVSVNPGMSTEECAQFVPGPKDSQVTKPTTIKMGANEFTALEQMNGEKGRQSDMKYYHLFKNGACYEFALDVETSRKADEDLAQVDRGQVFKKLEKVLTTARIKEVEMPGVEKAETAAASATESKTTDAKSSDSKSILTASDDVTSEKAQSATTAPDTKTEKAQVVTPEQK
jgi:hypothetical protein